MASEEPPNAPGLLERALKGETEAVRSLFSGQRERLKRLIRLRLKRELAGRVDESRILDEILKEASERLAEYARGKARPLSLWVRELACRKLGELQGLLPGTPDRRRITANTDSLTLHAGGLPIADAETLAARMQGEAIESDASDKADRRVYLQEAINSLDRIDREVIALKHFERLGFREIAEVLGLTEVEAGRRYLAAMRGLRQILPWDGRSRRG